MYTKDDLTDQTTLMKLLGYTDERSFVKWCKKNNIPIIKIGLKKYILSRFLTQIIDNQLFIFEKLPKATKEREGKFTPQNDLVSKYLAKYESNNKPKTTQ